MERSRTVLFVAYYFPPMGLSGVQRTLKFAKYLAQYGWKSTVLTVGPTGYFAFDPPLLKEVEEAGINVLRTGSLDPNMIFKGKGLVRMPSEGTRKLLQFFGDLLFVPDTKVGWKRKAIKAGSEFLRNNHCDAIIATAPPQTDFMIGLGLKKKFKVPLILDYRDAWLDYPFKFFPTPLHRWLHRRLEKKMVRGCDRIVVSHRRVKETLVKRYPFLTYHDVTIISQGFDRQDFSFPKAESAAAFKKLKIVHAGTFYGGRSPSVLIHAVHNVLKQFPQLRGRIDVSFIGNTRREDQNLVRKLGMQNDVNFLGYLEHHVCSKHLHEADVLWFVLDNDFQSPGKLYEYFGAKKPVFASIVDGYMKQLLLESKAAFCVPLNDQAAHEQVLLQLVKLFDERKLPKPPDDFVDRFDRRMLTGELARVLESLMDIDTHAFVKLGEPVA